MDKAVDERPTVKLGDRVFVAGVGYGRVTQIQRLGVGSPYYTVRLDGDDSGDSGPYTEVWSELKAPDPRERV